MALEVELDKKKLEYTDDEGQKVRVDVDTDLTDKQEDAFESNHYSNLAEELLTYDCIPFTSPINSDEGITYGPAFGNSCLFCFKIFSFLLISILVLPLKTLIFP